MNAKRLNQIMIILSVLGLAIASYLTIYHYFSNIPLICQNNSIINCANVLNSQYAVLFGIPVAVYGLAFFIVELLLLMYRNDNFTLLWNALGLGFTFYFFYSEYRLGNICEYCTAVHIIVIILLCISVYKFIKS